MELVDGFHFVHSKNSNDNDENCEKRGNVMKNDDGMMMMNDGGDGDYVGYDGKRKTKMVKTMMSHNCGCDYGKNAENDGNHLINQIIINF